MKDLTPKQQRFRDEYCVDFNGTQAAIRAGYSKNTAAEQASRLLRNVNMQEAIKNRLDELAMPAEEALKRLGDIAGGSVEHFVAADEDGQVYINLGTDDARANYKLLKKVKQTKTITRGDNGYEREEIKTEFELYNAQTALVDLLKVHGKFVDRVDHAGGLEIRINRVDPEE